MDILIHHIEEFKDPNWIQQTSFIANTLVKQKEREKQTLIESLGQKTDDERSVSVHLQQFGMENWYGSSSEQHLDYSQSEMYSEKMYESRVDAAKQLFNINEDADIFGDAGDTDIFGESSPQDIQEQDQGYEQTDADFEREGYAEGGDEGNYQED